ncbi:uncharacterized protein JN550_011262 [Neoarthrinium moseri]|uniref:uncharacterized protein n=1 Tax=Neoarthrinium moseri TaxID=1658444 RepID=UPI001FDB8EB6|nr:uncharacterized protein JN550_011262 [Neoarthrinium moseri]KAI1860800.1 hypothetical protein JN550_011262 [Neoarthrinium moseri]
MTTTSLYDQDGEWYWGIVNTDKHWKFLRDAPTITNEALSSVLSNGKGGGVPTKLVAARPRDPPLPLPTPPPPAVQRFAQAMQNGTDLEQAMQTLLDIGVDTPELIYQATIEESVELMLGDTVLVNAAEEGAACLEDILVTCGTDLLEALGLLVMTVATATTLSRHLRQPKERRGPVTLFSVSKGEFSLTFTNLTGEDWTRASYGVQDDMTDRVTTLPDTTLKGAHGMMGKQSLQWHYFVPDVGMGEANGFVVWRSPGGVNLGVNIHIPVQSWHMGTSPYYEVSVPDQKSGQFYQAKEPAEIFTWSGSGYKMTVSPQAGGTSFQADVKFEKA